MPKIAPPYLPNAGMPTVFPLCMDFKTFVDDTGTLGDAAGVTRSGTMGAGAVFAGGYPGYVTFSGGATGTVSIPDTGKNSEVTFVSGTHSYTLLAKFRSTSGGTGGLIAFGHAGNLGQTGILYYAGGKVSFSNWGDNAEVSTLCNDGNWHVAIVTFNHSTNQVKLYVDGVLGYTGTFIFGGNIELTGAAYLGTFGSGQGGYFSGDIDGAAYFSRIISSQEISDWSSDFFHTLESSQTYFSEDDVDVIERQVGDSTYPIVFKLRDSSNLLLGKTGASPSCVVSKNGSAFASCSGTVSEISSGYYKIHGAGLGADIGSIGQANIEVTATGAEPKSIIVNVVDHNPFIGIESFRSGTSQAGSGTTITLESGTTPFTLPATGGKAFITIVDGTGVGQCAPISSIDWNTLVATIQGSFATNPDSTSKYMIFISSYENVTVGGYATGQAPLQPTVSGRTLDVTATGCAGVDWANVEGQGSTVGLSGTTVKAIADPVEMATDFEIEAGIDFLKAMRAITAATSGLLSGAGTGTITIKGAGVSDTRIVATTDVNGNRTAITLSL